MQTGPTCKQDSHNCNSPKWNNSLRLKPFSSLNPEVAFLKAGDSSKTGGFKACQTPVGTGSFSEENLSGHLAKCSLTSAQAWRPLILHWFTSISQPLFISSKCLKALLKLCAHWTVIHHDRARSILPSTHPFRRERPDGHTGRYSGSKEWHPAISAAFLALA